MTDDKVAMFANSWRVGGSKACTRKNDERHPPRRFPAICQRKISPKCLPLSSYTTDLFSECKSHLNPQKYFEACVMDMCECPSGFCYCESFTAYARECQRLGMTLPDWRQQTNCTLQMIQQRTQNAQIQARRHHRKRMRTKRPEVSLYENYIIPKPIMIPPSQNRTPPPIH